MKKLLKVILIIVAIVALIMVLITATAATVAATSNLTLFGATAATTGIAGFGASILGALGFTSLSAVFITFGSIALAAFLIYDLAFKGGSTISDVATNAVKAAKKVFHEATDGIKKSAKHLQKGGSFFSLLKIMLIVAIVGMGYVYFKKGMSYD